jgi:choline kinase
MNRAVILAAGRGSRLEGETRDRPKCLVQVLGQSLLSWQVDSLRTAGISDIAVVGGYRAQLLKTHTDTVLINERWAVTAMVASLRIAVEAMGLPLLVSYSDIYYTADAVRPFLGRHDLAVGYVQDWLPAWYSRYNDPKTDAETFFVDEQGLVQDIGGQISDLATTNGQFCGLYSMSAAAWSVLERLEHEQVIDIDQLSSTEMLSVLVGQGIELHGLAVDGPWFEIDTPRDLEFARQMLAPQSDGGTE